MSFIHFCVQMNQFCILKIWKRAKQADKAGKELIVVYVKGRNKEEARNERQYGISFICWR